MVADRFIEAPSKYPICDDLLFIPGCFIIAISYVNVIIYTSASWLGQPASVIASSMRLVQNWNGLC
jgi:hypothetical protein